MDNKSLVEKISRMPVAYSDPIIHRCAKRLHAGEDAETVLLDALNELATERARLIQLRTDEALCHVPPKLVIGVKGKPLVEVFAEDEAKKG